MELKTKAIIYGLLLAVAAPLAIALFPLKVGDAFVCFADHLRSLLQSGGASHSSHLWSRHLWPSLCLWVISLAGTVIAAFALLGIWARAKR